VTYDVYFGTNTPPSLVATGLSATTFDPGMLEYCTTYYWQIVAWDNHGASTAGPIWEFTTNCLPNEPSNPDPSDGETDVSIDADLSWTGGDPDPDDTIIYDVYFGTSSPPPQVATGQSDTTYDPGTMDYMTTYYWQIVAWDNHGASTTGSIWEFTTEEEYIPIPDLDCDGVLNWEDVEYGETVTGEFTVENIGDPESLLDWEIESYPNWGTWTFDPESGVGLTPEDGTVIVQVEVTAPEEGSEFTGDIKLVNSENPDDFCTISATMKDAVSHSSALQQFLKDVIQRFSIIGEILQIILNR
jgi:hypothetical protein